MIAAGRSLLLAFAALLFLGAAPAGAALKPQLGRTVVLAPVTGSVFVQPPGAGRVRLLRATVVRVGVTVDATHGRVKLTSARDSRGRTQYGTFNGGEFVVAQSRTGGGLTDLRLAGGDFRSCSAGTAGASGAAAGVRRRLFGDAHGRFRTRGRNSSATVRGTEWSVEDRCDGTHTADMQGRVDTSSAGGLAYLLDPGETVTYYCSNHTVPAPPGTYCIVLLANPSEGLFGGGIIDVTPLSQYDLCVTGPVGAESCTTYPFGGPMKAGFRLSAVVCGADRGMGTYTVRWKVGDSYLSPSLATPLASPAEQLPCIHKP